MPENVAGMTGDRGLVRIGTRAADEGTCPARLAAKARPAMRPAQRSRARKPGMETFPLGPVMAAVDDVEFGGLPRDQALDRFGGGSKPLHPGAIAWGRYAVGCYLDSDASTGTAALIPVQHYWVVQRARGGRTWELYAWGRRYESPDGTLREFRFLRYGIADSGKRDPAQVAIAAYSAAFGVPASWPNPWGDPFELTAADPKEVRRVRVLEIGLAGGPAAVLFDGTPEEAEALYAEHARGPVRDITAGGSPQPGYGCADCKLVTACETLPRIPGVLGITDPAAPLRTWSVSNGRYYSKCPAQDHLIRLHLPRENEYDIAAVRGQAVHAWLAETHAGSPRSACTVWDIPARPDDWISGTWRITGDQAVDGTRMLANHADLCPFHRRAQITEVRLEPELAFHDTAANTIIITKPDMLYLDDGAWVWREIKTRQRLPAPGSDMLREFPQLALAVVLTAENAFGGKPSGARIELELLAPGGADVWLVDPNDPAEIAKARTVVHELAAPWHTDETAAAKPGPHCGKCPVRRWCPDAQPGERR